MRSQINHRGLTMQFVLPKIIILAIAVWLAALNVTMAQTVKEADPKDVSSLDAIMKATYDSISGEAGQPRNWDRFRSLSHKDARLIPVSKNAQTGEFIGVSYSPDDYITRAEPFFAKEGFHERELARHVDMYGNIAQVFSTYHAFHKLDEKTPFLRGINSFQLLNDGKRWWVVSIYWQAETPDNPVPKKFLKSDK